MKPRRIRILQQDAKQPVGRCVCHEPRECTDHLGVCEWCGCSMYEETRPPADLDTGVPLRDAFDSTPMTASEVR